MFTKLMGSAIAVTLGLGALTAQAAVVLDFSTAAPESFPNGGTISTVTPYTVDSVSGLTATFTGVWTTYTDASQSDHSVNATGNEYGRPLNAGYPFKITFNQTVQLDSMAYACFLTPGGYTASYDFIGRLNGVTQWSATGVIPDLTGGFKYKQFTGGAGIGINEVEVVTHKGTGSIPIGAIDTLVLTVPEPASLALMGLGGTLILFRRRK